MKRNRSALIGVGTFFIVAGIAFNSHFLAALFRWDSVGQTAGQLILVIQISLIVVGSAVILLRNRVVSYLECNVSRYKHILFALIAVALVLTIFFTVSEVFLRFVKPQETYSRLLSLVHAGEYAPCDFIPFTLKANTKFQAPSMESLGRKVNVTINSLGLRGKEVSVKKPKGVKRILILGDSYTYGVYVGDNETYAALLEKLFQEEEKKIEVLNAGYADGWDPDQHYAWLVNRGFEFEPDIVIYGFFIGNDIGASEKFWAVRDKHGLPLKIINNEIYIDEGGYIRSKNRDEKTVGYEAIYKIPLVRESHFIVFLSKRVNNFMRILRKKNYPVWGSRPFPFILEPENDAVMDKSESVFKKVVEGLAMVSKEHYAKFFILMIPINFQVEPKYLPRIVGPKFSIQRDYFAEFGTWLKSHDIPFLDLLKAMKATPGHYFPRNMEVHFNPEGHRFTAQRLKAALDSLGWLE